MGKGGHAQISAGVNVHQFHLSECICESSNTVREELFKSLDSFQDTFEGIETYYFSIYYGFPGVSKAAMSLGVAILKAIEEVISYYLQHTAFKVSEALWNGEDYKKSITSLKDITTFEKQFHLEAERASFKENYETHTGVIDENNGMAPLTSFINQTQPSVLTRNIKVHDKAPELPAIFQEMLLNFEHNL
ncbi:uncharacterized protein EAF01_007569 [Botrytis porri]|uniref:uncharacterized protein n=1 Tax=Botrytis porri TaxID=87229 RepID=UPI0018FF3B20|nr:uncharacterized protein EAF01_007569 [Botrytis porri]KAF7900267.1 hypothetical protein EAF01_007569 [Botrytis porri]